ncbi:MAG: hypothetical protein ACXWCG_08355, partial [Flavitalea sp.]
IAKSLCLDGHTQKSTYCFNCIIKNFKLSGSRKEFIEQEISSCNVPSGAAEEELVTTPDFNYINNVTLPEASVGGKMGKVYDCFSENQTINFSGMVSLDSLESRLFPIDQKNKALQKINGILNSNYKTAISGRYIIVTKKEFPITDNKVSYTANRLEKAYQFFVEYYSLRPPDKLLTVYILPHQTALRQTAQLVHGIQLPDPNIGYSNLSDLSLLGLGDAEQLGTLYHELFHLIIRTDVGDIPAFLDEGLASLYSVSRWENEKLVGDHRPWRLQELSEAKSANDSYLKIPPLEKLINYSWNEFDGQETKNVCQVAVNYALSNFLMIYLQEKNLLQKIVTAFKDRPFIPLDDSEPKSNVQIFENLMADSIKSFTNKFSQWFKLKYNFDLYAEVVSGGSIPVNMNQLLDNTRILLLETNEKVFKFKEPARYKMLEQELNDIENDYRKIMSNPTQNNINNAPLNVQHNAPLNVQQSMPADNNETEKNEIRLRLDAFEKKLRKLIFDGLPKQAN